jgi:hypothetical protein
MYLLYIGQTTTEHLRKVYNNRDSPYNLGVVNNWIKVIIIIIIVVVCSFLYVFYFYYVYFFPSKICCSSDYPSLLPDQTETVDASYFISRNQPRGVNELIVSEKTKANQLRQSSGSPPPQHVHNSECKHVRYTKK